MTPPPPPPRQTTWQPPAWVVESLQESGDHHLLHEATGQEASGSGSPPQSSLELSEQRDTDVAADATDEAHHGTPVSAGDEYDAPPGLLFSGLYQGHVTIGNNGMYFGIGTTESGQHYVDTGTDPTVDSSWFDEMLKPLDPTSIPQYYPVQGSNWGLVR